MRLLNFNKPKNLISNPEVVTKERLPEQGLYIDYETDNPEEVVTGKKKKTKKPTKVDIQPASERADHLPGNATALPWANTTYNVEPGHGIALVDVLRRVAKNVKVLVEAKSVECGPANASAEINWKQAFAIIKKVFKTHKIKLVEFKDRNKHECVPYYTKNTTDGIYFWISPRENTDEALKEAVRQLQANGMAAIRKECGILLNAAMPNSEVFTPEQVAHYCNGVHVPSKGDWSILDMDGVTLHYKYSDNDSTLYVHCLKGPIKTATFFPMQHANSKQIARVLKYQAVRYKRLFTPETYGLTAASEPFKLKKHIITYCGNGRSLIITPEDHAYVVTDKGESLLCKTEGKIGLKPGLSFKTVTNSTKYTFGDIWSKFGHLLAKRGLFL